MRASSLPWTTYHRRLNRPRGSDYDPTSRARDLRTCPLAGQYGPVVRCNRLRRGEKRAKVTKQTMQQVCNRTNRRIGITWSYLFWSGERRRNDWENVCGSFANGERWKWKKWLGRTRLNDRWQMARRRTCEWRRLRGSRGTCRYGAAWSLHQADDEAKSRFAWFRWPASTTPASGGRPMEGVEWGDSWTLAGSYE